ncbi:hypothetical protein B484DRAFT_459420 [Ochromonadaceae sp. CCMP2298]|nr:hypothetical protein B484DRAFT_459420 [Ochromonadaceae sp. CCMP2298]|mmetsp:Transcript_2077/g.4896  ORF Transcript_2077/g.4896 Transcript_2077/m.4896 type:complete len:391 (-) Transcript_2077:750-1922(-)
MSIVVPPLKKGWMRKQGRKGMIKNWKRRFFVLNGGRIGYFDNALDDFPFGDGLKGELHLANTEMIQENKKYNDKQIFVVSFSGEYNLLMEAETPEDADEWMSAITEHIRYANLHASDTATSRNSRLLKAGSMAIGASESSVNSSPTPSMSSPSAQNDEVASAQAVKEVAEPKPKSSAVALKIEAEKLDFAQFCEKAPVWVQELSAMVMGNDSRITLVTNILTSGQVLVTNLIKNTGEGEFGTRGEQYLGAIFVLSCSIILGLHSLLEMLIRFLISVSAGLYIVLGGALIVLGLFELRANVSLFHLPIERNKLITSGVFQLVRHPMYGGLLLLCIGLSITGRRWDKMVLSVILGLVLDKVADLEEAALLQEHPLAYRAVINSRKKFIPFLC